jgi:N-acylneuraminate cytidylyltransferase
MFAYIPARGGSKRIPRKNIRHIGGKPALSWVIQSLRQLDFLSAVHVSTDDPEIAAIAEQEGAICLGPRAPELADSESGFIDLIHRDAQRYSEYNGGDREMLFVLATAVLVPPKVYSVAHQEYLSARPDVLMSCEPFNSPPWWALMQKGDGSWGPIFPEEVLISSQHLPRTLADAGLFYFFNLDTMRQYQSVKMVKHLHPFIVPHRYVVDVDTPEDWEILEEKFERLHQQNDAKSGGRS